MFHVKQFLWDLTCKIVSRETFFFILKISKYFINLNVSRETKKMGQAPMTPMELAPPDVKE